MESIEVYIETGKKKTFASAVDWPGWSRSGHDEIASLQALNEYGQRYDQVMQGTGIGFQTPKDTLTELTVVERFEGNATTDFGAPAIVPQADRRPFDTIEYQRSMTVLKACWGEFNRAVERARGVELRKGPRGGGRDLVKIIDHVLEADRGYLSRLAWKHKRGGGEDLTEELVQTRTTIRNALEVALYGNLPQVGPRGGVIWPPRYFVRRVAWRVLDHAWEIDDRIL